MNETIADIVAEMRRDCPARHMEVHEGQDADGLAGPRGAARRDAGAGRRGEGAGARGGRAGRGARHLPRGRHTLLVLSPRVQGRDGGERRGRGDAVHGRGRLERRARAERHPSMPVAPPFGGGRVERHARVPREVARQGRRDGLRPTCRAHCRMPGGVPRVARALRPRPRRPAGSA